MKIRRIAIIQRLNQHDRHLIKLPSSQQPDDNQDDWDVSR